MSKLGVVIGRFQIPSMHSGHRQLIEIARAECTKVMVVLGVSSAYSTHRNPLSFEARKAMILEIFPDVYVAPLKDHPSDEVWSQNLDQLISLTGESFDDIVLYGSRDSFIPHYSGNHTTKATPPHPDSPSGTAIREEIKQLPMYDSVAFRRGVVYSILNRPPIVYPVVDVAVLRGDKVLLARKESDPSHRYRFIGGFVDSTDKTLEIAAQREVQEEASLYVPLESFKYRASCRVRDWRYPGDSDVILSSFFTAQFLEGSPTPADDIVELEWFPLDRVVAVIVESHMDLAITLIER